MGKKKKPNASEASNSSHRKDSTRKEAVQTDTTNKPRNLLVTDATTPFTFSFCGRFGVYTAPTVNQTAAEDTWPGGALWDLGVLLSQVLVAISGGDKASTTLTTSSTTGKSKSTTRIIQLPSRLVAAIRSKEIELMDASLVLELGCGVGLTGLVAAAALHAKTTVLTDLPVVIDQVTRPNVEQNTVASTRGGFRTITKGQGKVVSMPLCWGSAADEKCVQNFLVDSACASSSSPNSRRRRKSSESRDQGPKKSAYKDGDSAATNRIGVPDVVLIGDVAYQHKPGAPSHFDALLSTLLKFSDSKTLVVFGTRIRMPASVDLLNLLLQHFDELVNPPLSAEEIDSQFSSVKHNMSIHFLRKKISKVEPQNSGE